MRTIFVKKNIERDERFNLTTKICVENNKKFIIKSANTTVAQKHLINMLEMYEPLKKAYKNFEICPVEQYGNDLKFEYVQGQSLTSLFLKAKEDNDVEQFEKLVNYQISALEVKDDNYCEFVSTEKFEQVFGKQENLQKYKAIKISAFDATCNNIILRENDKPVLIDYEWSFDFPIPQNFVILRCIHSMYLSFFELEKFYPFDELCKKINIDFDMETFASMEEKMFDYIVCNTKWYGNTMARYAKANNNIGATIASQKSYIQELGQAIYCHTNYEKEQDNKIKELGEAVCCHINYEKEQDDKIKELNEAVYCHINYEKEQDDKIKELGEAVYCHINYEKEQDDKIKELGEAVYCHINYEKELEEKIKSQLNSISELSQAIYYHNNYEKELNEEIEKYHKTFNFRLKNKIKKIFNRRK